VSFCVPEQATVLAMALQLLIQISVHSVVLQLIPVRQIIHLRGKPVSQFNYFKCNRKNVLSFSGCA
jgi:hypothetical protein